MPHRIAPGEFLSGGLYVQAPVQFHPNPVELCSARPNCGATQSFGENLVPFPPTTLTIPVRREIRATGCCTSPGFEAAGLVVGTDASGGPYTKDARARHVGWAVIFGKLTDNGVEVVGTMSGVLPSATVPEGESYAIVQALMVSSGTLDVTSDCRPAIKYTKQRAFTEKVPLRWSRAGTSGTVCK